VPWSLLCCAYSNRPLLCKSRRVTLHVKEVGTEHSLQTWTGLVSITITLFNKAVFSVFNFKYPMTLFVAQARSPSLGASVNFPPSALPLSRHCVQGSSTRRRWPHLWRPFHTAMAASLAKSPSRGVLLWERRWHRVSGRAASMHTAQHSSFSHFLSLPPSLPPSLLSLSLSLSLSSLPPSLCKAGCRFLQNRSHFLCVDGFN
jgi:hypothetical protein